MSEESETKPGVWASLKRILDTLLALSTQLAETILVEPLHSS